MRRPAREPTERSPIQNGIGLLLTVLPISLAAALVPGLGERVVWLLLPGPVLGLLAFSPLVFARAEDR